MRRKKPSGQDSATLQALRAALYCVREVDDSLAVAVSRTCTEVKGVVDRTARLARRGGGFLDRDKNRTAIWEALLDLSPLRDSLRYLTACADLELDSRMAPQMGEAAPQRVEGLSCLKTTLGLLEKAEEALDRHCVTLMASMWDEFEKDEVAATSSGDSTACSA